MKLKHIIKTHTLQIGQSDCGVACLISIIKFYNGNNTFENIRELSGTSVVGTTMLGLQQAANSIGFDAQGYKATIEALKQNNLPVILLTFNEGQAQHYIVCYQYNKQKGFLIGDPAKGVFWNSENELDSKWHSKKCLVLAPDSSFVTVKKIKIEQKNYFLKLLKEDAKLLIFSIILGVLIAGLGLSMSIFSQKLIDDILPSQKINKLIIGIVLLTILQLSRIGLILLREFFLIEQSKRFNNRINNQFFNALLYLKKSFFDSRKIGELVARTNDINRVQGVIKMIVSNFVIDILVSILSLIFLFFYSWQITIIALVSLPFYFIIIYKSNNKIIYAQKDIMQTNAYYESNYISSMQGITTIKNINNQSIFAEINRTIFKTFQDKLFNLGKINIAISSKSGLANVLIMTVVLVYASISVLNDNLKIGELMAVIGVTSSLLTSITNLALISIPINEAKIAFNRMFEFTSIQPEHKGEVAINEFQSLQIQNVSFRFAGRSQLLKNINLEIKKGEWISVVGESGSGKSTLGQILQKFYDFENGQIIVNQNLDFRKIILENWRNLLGVIPQEIHIFNGNVIDNILLGTADNPEKVIVFCQNMGFDKFINELPQSYATILGEEGINLSGGQKQIIALARVLYKNPQFLILDEATAAMDRKTEKFTLELLQKIKSGVGILFISHRLHSLKEYADRIYVLENGIISHFGTHQELIQSENFYSEFWSELHSNL